MYGFPKDTEGKSDKETSDLVRTIDHLLNIHFHNELSSQLAIAMVREYEVSDMYVKPYLFFC